MGGYGSTRWGWHSKKTTVDECTSFSTSDLVRYVGLGPNVHRPWGSLAWRNTRTGEETSSIGVEIETSDIQGWARLHYSFTAGRNKGEKMDYRVSLVTTWPYFGGVRWWFICPLTVNGRYCGRRVGKLYLPPRERYFGCRHCYDLAYKSSQTHDKSMDIYKRMDLEALMALLDSDDLPRIAKALTVVLDRLGRL